jgi:hypothetical protein
MWVHTKLIAGRLQVPGSLEGGMGMTATLQRWQTQMHQPIVKCLPLAQLHLLRSHQAVPWDL